MFKQYYERAKTFAVYPNDKGERYLNLGLIGETGEAAEKVKKLMRDTNGDIDDPETWSEEVKRLISLELGDICWYAIMSVSKYVYQWVDLRHVKDSEKEDAIEQAWNNLYENYKQDNESFEISVEETPIDKLIVSLTTNVSRVTRTKPVNDMLCCSLMVADYSSIFSIIRCISLKLGKNLNDIFNENIEKLTSRQKRDKIHGSGDER